MIYKKIENVKNVYRNFSNSLKNLFNIRCTCIRESKCVRSSSNTTFTSVKAVMHLKKKIKLISQNQ